MLIGLLSDIHGNHIACQNVLREASQLGVDELCVLGDFVGYYYRPDRVLEQMSSWKTTFIKGNHEVMLERVMNDQAFGELVRQKYGSGINEALACLSPEQLSMLVGLPEKVEIVRDGLKILLCHGSPWDSDAYVYPNSPKEVLARVCDSNHDFIFFGHSHYPFAYRGQNSMAINVGSVGQGRDRGGFASWATLDTVSRTFAMRQTPYDVTELVAETKKRDPQVKYLHEILERKYGSK